MANLPNEFPADPLETDILELTERVVDQVVVDGLVDGQNLRVAYHKLGILAFGRIDAFPELEFDFRNSLTAISRFVDRDGEEFGYKPVLRANTDVRASLTARIIGTARCTRAEREEALELMDTLANLVYDHNYKHKRTMTMKQIGGSLREALQVERLGTDTFGAFMLFIRRDPRFHVINHNRVALTKVDSDK